jgi:hypothetical protein
MSECTRLSDRIPEVALGRARWTPDQAAHLQACADCRAELAVVQATIALGRKAPGLSDPARVAEAVERRLVGGRSRRAWGSRVAGLAAAAALLLTVWTRWPAGPLERAASRAPVPASQALVPLPELELLDPAELDSLLQRMEMPVAGSSTLDAPSLGDLEDTELEQVLATWEG